MALALLENSRDEEREQLLRKIERLEEDLEDARTATMRAVERSNSAIRALANLRKQLDPLYRALRAVFGELDTVTDDASIPANQPIPSSVYDAWKQRLPPACGRVIDALLVQPMGYGQLKNYCKMGASTLDQALAKLRANSLIEKDGTLNRLKRL